MAEQLDVAVDDGHVLRVHDSGADPEAVLTVVWHNGSPHTGALLPPVVDPARDRRIRVITYARPSYGGSTPRPGRAVSSAATDVERIVDRLGVDRFATLGASGGGPHALACAAVLGDRVTGVVTFAGVAPVDDEPDWFEGMAAPGGLRAALHGREARELFAETDEFDPSSFVPADYAELDGTWRPLGADAGEADRAGAAGLIDDDVAFTTPWGVDLGAIVSPALVVQGALDRVIPRSHGERLVGAVPTADLWLRPRDGHVSVLTALPVAFDWLLAHGDHPTAMSHSR
ncbi:Haloalkane dehalogenase 2 [Frondihabitans sp. 762G35]|uniref:alpha/beta fold hydrolase n=1 Tax=Frondihabitans sp. 762G35 TaxID=1446794 RepID=UPI000D20BAF9|nr:alpha/beta fold hydrolase [Frondihabitans sp. 762G35]ARC58504.1 Haloalkane dehalogenase 2 [Frondihabitans sp. 762G35]